MSVRARRVPHSAAPFGAGVVILAAACTRYAPPEAPAFPPAHTPVRPSPDTTDTGTDSEPTRDTAPPPDTSPPLDTTDDDRDGYSEAQGDCDDGNSRVSPDRREWCNRVDDDCDGLVDPGCDDNTVSVFWEGYVESDADGFRAGVFSDSWYDIDSNLLCAYTLELQGEGPTAAGTCPSCTWSYATTGSRVEWRGAGCDHIDLPYSEIEAGWGNFLEFGLVAYIGYGPSYEVQRWEDGPIYVFGSTVFLNTNAGQGSRLTEDSHNYYPWGDYQVTVAGSVVSWSRLSAPDYYTYTPP